MMILQFHNFLLEGLCSEYLGMAVSLFVEMIINLSSRSVWEAAGPRNVWQVSAVFLERTVSLGIVPDLNFQNMGKLIKLKSLLEKTKANIDTFPLKSSEL